MRALKRLGQNFLKNTSAVKKIVSALEIEPEDIVIEIGPGKGRLTKEILKRTNKLILIEKDHRFIDLLESLSNSKDFKVIEGDVREVLVQESERFSLEGKGDYKIVGNIPYYLTGQLLRILQELKNPPKMAILMVQKEVAQRIAIRREDPPSSRKIGTTARRGKNNQLATIVSLWAKPKILFHLAAKDFSPPPKVKSSVVKFEFLPQSQRFPTLQTSLRKDIDNQKELQWARKNEQKLIDFIKLGYNSPRKTLINNLTKNWKKEKIRVAMKEMNLGERSRPGDLTKKDWIELKKMI